jgi:uncharacterized glyoxalase superfamily protein PhnB
MSNEPTLRAVAPIFQVANMQRSIDYYRRVMGFEIGWISGEPPTHASVCRDNVEINLVLESAPAPSSIYVYVNGVDDFFARITAAGAIVKVPLADRSYGMRDGRIHDPDGNAINPGEPLVKD